MHMLYVSHGLHVPQHVTTELHASCLSHSPHLPVGLHSLKMPTPGPLRSPVIPIPSRPPMPTQVAMPVLQPVLPYLLMTMLPPVTTLSPSVDSLLAMIYNLAKEVADGKVKQV